MTSTNVPQPTPLNGNFPQRKPSGTHGTDLHVVVEQLLGLEFLLAIGALEVPDSLVEILQHSQKGQPACSWHRIGGMRGGLFQITTQLFNPSKNAQNLKDKTKKSNGKQSK
jgi:hypothetical protein